MAFDHLYMLQNSDSVRSSFPKAPVNSIDGTIVDSTPVQLNTLAKKFAEDWKRYGPVSIFPNSGMNMTYAGNSSQDYYFEYF